MVAPTFVPIKLYSPTGNRTRAFHVTGGDTDHYTIEDPPQHFLTSTARVSSLVTHWNSAYGHNTVFATFEHYS
jgi:hypothetical protein